ncbi:MAG: type I glyceraldehyde-3-phosphate dehydrogenase [Candidatus Komeilibacteria bacterium]|nr:type I glyceraldehyde-3-phosphate dehydrogenase [Candidatus Komeilibacteria bacterium]
MSKKIKVAINGFGRIGRAAFKIALANKDLEVVAVNDLSDNNTLAHLLKYDSVYGRFNHEVTADNEYLTVDGKKFKFLAIKEPLELPWKELAVDVVLECTGIFRTTDKAGAHLKAGAKKVILSAPGKDSDIKTFVIGVNEDKYNGEQIINNASCTTNCVAPVMEIVKAHWGIKKALLSTVHSYTADQNLIDGSHKDLRRARSAAINIVPTSTGAAKATGEVIPSLKGKFDGLALRVPTPVVSLSDFSILTEKPVTKEELNAVFTEAAASPKFKNILAVTNEPIVSSDLIGDPHSSIVDLSLTAVVDGDLVKIISWYDNEWGYANRLVEMIKIVG